MSKGHTGPTFWHGGFPGLTVGSRLLSPYDAAAARIPISYTPRDRPQIGLVSRTDILRAHQHYADMNRRVP